jgi:hypothetical protein
VTHCRRQPRPASLRKWAGFQVRAYYGQPRTLALRAATEVRLRIISCDAGSRLSVVGIWKTEQ